MEEKIPNSNESFLQQQVEKFVNTKNIYQLHVFLLETINQFEKTHSEKYNSSKLGQELQTIREWLNKMAELKKDDDEYTGIYLVYLTSVAKKLQELNCYHAKNFTQLGDILLQTIDSFRQQNATHYLKCTINEDNSILYSLSNSINLLSKAGPLAFSSSAIIDGIVVPFYQNEFKLFNLIPVGAKNHLNEDNKKFSSENLRNSYQISRQLQRYRLQRSGKIHKGHSVNVFEAVYTQETKKPALMNTFDNTIYIIGIQGNAYNAPGMLQYLDQQVLRYMSQFPEVNRVIALAPDYPGSAASGGKFSSMDELAEDSIVLVIKHLLKRGVSPAQIIAIGHSLGGAVLVTGLNQLQQEGIITTAISLNSFSQAQKFVGNSAVIGNGFIKNYNNDATTYFQNLPKHRRHLEHTENDTVIALKISLLKSLDNNKEKINEGKLLKFGGHDLKVHDLLCYFAKVAQAQTTYRLEDDKQCFAIIRKMIEPIIFNQKLVKTGFVMASSYEDDDLEDRTELGKIKREYNLIYKKIAEFELGKSVIMLGFIYDVYTRISSMIENDKLSRSFLTPRSRLLDALDELKNNIAKNFFSKENVGNLFMNLESLSHYHELFLKFKQQVNLDHEEKHQRRFEYKS